MKKNERKKFVLTEKEIEAATGTKEKFNKRLAKLAVEALVGLALVGIGMTAGMEMDAYINVFNIGGLALTYDGVHKMITAYRSRSAFEKGTLDIEKASERGKNK